MWTSAGTGPTWYTPSVQIAPGGYHAPTHPSSDGSVFRSGTSGAGPNADGVLVVHGDTELVYTSDDSYCGLPLPEDCAGVNASGVSADPVVLQVLALFPETATPRVAGVTFGIAYDDCVQILDWSPCADFELPDANWPESGEGTAMTWLDVQTTVVQQVYWFAAYVEAPEVARFAVVPHPVQEAVFADDSIPSILDAVAGLGSFGFYSPGDVPCRTGSGGCCLDAECLLIERELCFLRGGAYQGDGSTCDPNPCGPVPVFERSWGQVKAKFRE